MFISTAIHLCRGKEDEMLIKAVSLTPASAVSLLHNVPSASAGRCIDKHVSVCVWLYMFFSTRITVCVCERESLF